MVFIVNSFLVENCLWLVFGMMFLAVGLHPAFHKICFVSRSVYKLFISRWSFLSCQGDSSWSISDEVN